MAVKNLSIECLRAFVTVVEVGGFTQAGELLGRSQPAISLQIKRLEEALARPLLMRSGQKLSLTEGGLRVFERARQLLLINDEMVSEFSGDAVTGKLHLGIPSEFASALLPKMVGSFSQNYPHVALEVTSDLSRNLLAKGRRESFDLVLALHEGQVPGDAQVLVNDELVWVASNRHSTQLLQPLPLVLAPEGCMYRKRAQAALREAGIPSRNVFTIPDLNGLVSALEAGLGVTVLTRSTVPEGLRVIRSDRQLPPLGEISIGLHFKKGRPSGAALRLAEYLQSGLKTL